MTSGAFALCTDDIKVAAPSNPTKHGNSAKQRKVANGPRACQRRTNDSEEEDYVTPSPCPRGLPIQFRITKKGYIYLHQTSPASCSNPTHG